MKKGAASYVLGVTLMLAPASTLAGMHKRYRVDGWILALHHDRFTNQTHCSLASSDARMAYQPGAIGFRPARGGDTLESWYRVDNGAPVRWEDRSAGLSGRGFQIDGPGLDDPTGGWVWIPLEELSHAQSVAIRLTARDRIRVFSLRGFAASLDTAHRLGCTSDASFES